MNKPRINFKPRNPVGWLLMSLFIPFFYFFWLVSSHKQINRLNAAQAAAGPIKMSPWWPTSLFVIAAIALAGALTVALVGDVDLDEYSALPVPAASAHVIDGGADHLHPESYILTVDDSDPYSGSIYDSDQSSDSTSYLLDNEDDVTGAAAWFVLLYFLGGMLFLAFSIVHFFYMLRHTDGVVGLAGNDQDKTYLIVMAAIGSFVFPPLLVAIVHRSQTVINQSLDQLQSGSD